MRRVPIEEMGQFQADVGYVYPVYVEHEDGRLTQPFARLTDPDVKDAVARHLSEEFGCSLERVQSEWTRGPDALYVCTTSADQTVERAVTDNQQSSLVGFVAIDRQRFRPYVSHLYVTEEHRGKGVASQLLQVVEASAREMGFSEVRLWCKSPLVAFYLKRGYQVYTQQVDDGVVVDDGDDDGESVVHLRKRLGGGAKEAAACPAAASAQFGLWH